MEHIKKNGSRAVRKEMWIITWGEKNNDVEEENGLQDLITVKHKMMSEQWG